MTDDANAIAKTLSANDTSETGAHQAGILIPKQPEILGFFPQLDPTQRNPRLEISCLDEYGKLWKFNFIYYNNALSGGTRNEYRLTGMTRYIRESGLTAGDQISFRKASDGGYVVTSTRAPRQVREKGSTIRLGSTWKVVSYRR